MESVRFKTMLSRQLEGEVHTQDYKLCYAACNHLIIHDFGNIDFPIKVITDIAKAMEFTDSDVVSDWWHSLEGHTSRAISKLKGVFTGHIVGRGGPADDYSSMFVRYVVLPECIRLIDYDVGSHIVVNQYFKRFLGINVAPLIALYFHCKEACENDLLRVMQIWNSGLLPLGLSDGIMCAFCANDLLETLQIQGVMLDSESDLNLIEDEANDFLRRMKEHPGLVDIAANPVDHLSYWEGLRSASDKKKQFKCHLRKMFPKLRGDNSILLKLVNRFDSFDIVSNELVLIFLDIDGCTFKVSCSAPWTEELYRIPLDLAPILGVHNGFNFENGVFSMLPFNGREFDFNYEEWYVRQEQPTMDPWSLEPVLAPFIFESDAFVYHPVDCGEDGSAQLYRWFHDDSRKLLYSYALSQLILEQISYNLGILDEISW